MMMETNMSRSLRLVFAGGAAVGIGMLAQPAMAQQADTSTAAPVQRVEITGSSIRRVDAETPSPVQVINAEDLKKSGYTSIAQVLQNITANGQGTLSQGFPQAFAGGASGISLRGLTTSATLVLIDGHRMAPYPLSDDGQRSFVDVSNIPFDAVERVEVLKDGASAVYGSDAMAGVVNIILKKNYTGTTVNAEAGTTDQGGGTTTHFSLTHGMGNLDEDGYNAYASLEYRHSDKITYEQRAGDGQWINQNWLPEGGASKVPGMVSLTNPIPLVNTPYLLNPNANSALSPLDPSNIAFLPGQCNQAALVANQCTYQNKNLEITPETSNVNLLTSFTKRLTDGWQLDVKASIFDSKAEQYTPISGTPFPQSFVPNVAVGAGVPPTVIGSPISSITVPANYTGNPYGAPAQVVGMDPDAPASHTAFDSRAYRFVADLTGTVGEWDLDTSLGYTKVSTKQSVYGGMNVPAMNAALNRCATATSGCTPYSLTGGNTAADIAAIYPTMYATDDSTLEFFEFKATRSLFTLPGGDLGISTGVSYIHRDMESPAPSLIADGIIGGNNAFVSGSQNNAAAFAEIAAPVLKTLEIDGAARFDHISNSGGGGWNSTTPKLGFKWSPTSAFALRGTYATGFRAPNAAEAGNSGQSYLASSTNDPILCPNGDPTKAGAVIAYCNYQAVTLNQSYAQLQPEKSKSGTLGVILEPIKGWSSTVDLYKIKIDNQIIAGPGGFAPVRASSPITQVCADGSGGSYTCAPGTGDNTVGPVLYYPNHYVNANSTTTSGIELNSKYKFKLGDYGTLLANLDWSHTASYILDQPGFGAKQLAGTHGPFVIGGDTGNPKDRINAVFTWDKDAWQVTTAFNWISGYNLTDPSYFGYLDTCAAGATVDGWFPFKAPPSQYCNVASFLDTDLTIRYKATKNLTVHFGITNLFDRQPPVDVSTYGGGALPYNPSMHLQGAIGRFVNAGVNYNF